MHVTIFLEVVLLLLLEQAVGLHREYLRRVVRLLLIVLVVPEENATVRLHLCPSPGSDEGTLFFHLVEQRGLGVVLLLAESDLRHILLPSASFAVFSCLSFPRSLFFFLGFGAALKILPKFSLLLDGNVDDVIESLLQLPSAFQVRNDITVEILPTVP